MVHTWAEQQHKPHISVGFSALLGASLGANKAFLVDKNVCTLQYEY